VDPGNYVTASSQPGIAVITSMKPTTVEFTVPQASLASVLQRVRGGQTLTVTAWNSDNSRMLGSGTLYAIGNQMATATGTVPLRASFPNDDEALFPNEFVNVRLLVDTLQHVVLVPTPAVQSGAPGDYVYLVRPDQTVAVRKVALGPGDGQHTVVTSGLATGDVVVTSGMDRLSDGAKIRLAGAAPSGPAAAASAPAAGHRQHGAASGTAAP
jgi:multidrug efflux system membrane fusion protein